MRLLFRLLAPLMLALAVLGTATGCTPEEQEAPIVATEDEVREEVGRALDAVKGADEDTVRELLGAQISRLLDSLGISPEPLWRAVTSRFTYEIESVDVSGNVAEVRVRATNVDVAEAADEWGDTLDSLLADATILVVPGRLSDTVNAAMESLISILESPDTPTVTDTVTLVMTKGTDGWQPPSSGTVAAIVFAGQDIGTLADLG